MGLILKTKKLKLQAAVIFEVLLLLFIYKYSDSTAGHFTAWFTGGQFIIFMLLFMPETRHGVGKRYPGISYTAARIQWDKMTPAEQTKVTNEGWHDSTIWLMFFIKFLLTFAFVVGIWVPFIFPAIVKLFP